MGIYILVFKFTYTSSQAIFYQVHVIYVTTRITRYISACINRAPDVSGSVVGGGLGLTHISLFQPRHAAYPIAWAI